MKKTRTMHGYTLMELIVGMMMVSIALALIVPSGRHTKESASVKTTAEELVARFRQARQTAITKSVPVAVAFPISDTLFHTEEAYFLEGEVTPKVSTQWKIQQSFPEVAYYVGQWAGPEWEPAPTMKTPSAGFKPETWFGPVDPPPARLFIFTPSGNVVSSARAADGKYRVVVAMGVSEASGMLTAANTPYTVWISPSGEVGLEKGLYKGGVFATSEKNSAPMAQYVPPATVSNKPPVVQVMRGKTLPGPKAYPDNVNPKTNNGNSIAVDGVLTLELRVKDENGDPPYFRWKTVEAGTLNDDGMNHTRVYDMAEWGGRFSNVGEVRMEWDAENQEWVGRDTWAPATGDKGGNRYLLECDIRDRKGGVAQARFPVDGHYLVTTNEPWVLYKTWNPQNRAELWKMTLDGLDHTLVCSFPNQDVHYGQWSPSGTEIIVGAADGVYRVSSDGAVKKKIVSVNLNGGTMDGCCLSPEGDAVFYAYGREYDKLIRKVYIDGSGIQRTIPLAPEPPEPGIGGLFSPPSDPNPLNKVGTLYDLSSAQFGSKTALIASYYHYNRSGGLLGTGLFAKKKKYRGAIIMDPDTGDRTTYSKPQSWNQVGQRNSKYPPYGVSFATVGEDTGSGSHVHVLHGSPEGIISIDRIERAGFPPQDNFVRATTSLRRLDTGLGDVHHPKYATPDHSSMVFVAGRGTDAKIYYMPNINSPRAYRELRVVPGVNKGAEIPSVSRPRPRSG